MTRQLKSQNQIQWVGMMNNTTFSGRNSAEGNCIFSGLLDSQVEVDENFLKQIYAYAKGIEIDITR